MNAADSSKGASTEDLQHHYDVGTDFYELWLDSSMVYSSAMYEDLSEDLSDAQWRKVDYHLDQALGGRSGRLLDVGCGWGSVLHRASEIGCTGVGLNLSADQHAFTQARFAEVPAISTLQESWRNHTDEGYDGIVCIGALEHFAGVEDDDATKTQHYREFFEFCQRALKPGGRLSLQTIAYGDFVGQIDPFISNEIFPGSDLPTLGQLANASQHCLQVTSLRNDPLDYGRTCREWAKRLEENQELASNIVGDELVDTYLRFLRMSAAGFELGALQLLRITLTRSN